MILLKQRSPTFFCRSKRCGSETVGITFQKQKKEWNAIFNYFSRPKPHRIMAVVTCGSVAPRVGELRFKGWPISAQNYDVQSLFDTKVSNCSWWFIYFFKNLHILTKSGQKWQFEWFWTALVSITMLHQNFKHFLAKNKYFQFHMELSFNTENTKQTICYVAYISAVLILSLLSRWREMM